MLMAPPTPIYGYFGLILLLILSSSQSPMTSFDHAQAYLLSTYILIHIPVFCDILYCENYGLPIST